MQRVEQEGLTTAGGCAAHMPAAQLVAHLYALADLPMRARMLADLMRPLGTLGLAAVAAGALVRFARRDAVAGMAVALDDAARYTAQQVLELASFVEQVDADIVQQVATQVIDQPAGIAAVGLAVGLVWLRTTCRQPHRLARGTPAVPARHDDGAAEPQPG